MHKQYGNVVITTRGKPTPYEQFPGLPPVVTSFFSLLTVLYRE